ncbi:glycosyltransferase family 25 protein [Tabrizicola sp. WMC-M-20]|nr:glycosyltransferase family 25 protein [Tabrizicola sp. WMC-M-20]
MMLTYCINLDRRLDRWSHMLAQFERLGLVVTRMSATDGQDPEVRTSLLRHPASDRLSPGALACFESHRRAWQALLDSGASHAMILEDDLMIAPGMQTLQILGAIPETADLIKIETNGTRVHIARTSQVSLAQGRRLAGLRSYHSGTGGYIISARLAGKLLALSQTSLEPVDSFLFNADAQRAIDILQMVPAPVVQGASPLVRASAGDWAQTSITEHWAAEADDSSDRPESRVQRVWRRFREEIRAKRLQTRYVTVGWG